MTALTSSPQRAQVAAPLFVLGAPDSGTTLLYRSLALHSRAAWISNYCRWLPALPELGFLNRIAARAPLTRARVWFGDESDEAYGYRHPRSVLERWFPQPVEGEPFFERRGVQPGAGSSPDEEQLRLRADFRRLARASGGDVVISKRLEHNLRIPLLAAVFPDARFVAVTRDGRAVANSLLYDDWWPDHDLWWWEGTPIDWARTGHNPIDAAAEHWVREVAVIKYCLAGLPQERVQRVSYEDLVAKPHETLEAVADFAGLGPDPSWQRALDHLSFPDRNRQVSHDHIYERATVLQQDMLAALGYRP